MRQCSWVWDDQKLPLENPNYCQYSCCRWQLLNILLEPSEQGHSRLQEGKIKTKISLQYQWRTVKHLKWREAILEPAKKLWCQRSIWHTQSQGYSQLQYQGRTKKVKVENELRKGISTSNRRAQRKACRLVTQLLRDWKWSNGNLRLS